MYIDGRPKASGNIAGFISNTKPSTTNNQPNFIFERREGNRVFVCAIKSTVAGKEFLVNYNLNQVDMEVVIMVVISILFYPTYR